MRTERKRASQISFHLRPGRLADTGAIDPRPWEHSVTQVPTPCFALRRRRARRRTRGARGARPIALRQRGCQPQGQEHNPQPNVSLSLTAHSSHNSRHLASIVSDGHRVRERRAVAGLSVFHARKLSIFQVSRVTKGRSRRSSQNENRTNDHLITKYQIEIYNCPSYLHIGRTP